MCRTTRRLVLATSTRHGQRDRAATGSTWSTATQTSCSNRQSRSSLCNQGVMAALVLTMCEKEEDPALEAVVLASSETSEGKTVDPETDIESPWFRQDLRSVKQRSYPKLRVPVEQADAQLHKAVVHIEPAIMRLHGSRRPSRSSRQPRSGTRWQ